MIPVSTHIHDVLQFANWRDGKRSPLSILPVNRTSEDEINTSIEGKKVTVVMILVRLLSQLNDQSLSSILLLQLSGATVDNVED